MKKILIVISIVFNLLLLAGLGWAWNAIRDARNQLDESDLALTELNRSWVGQLDLLESERLKLNQNSDALAVELANARTELEKVRRQMSAGSSAPSLSGHSAQKPESNGSALDPKINRARSAGRSLAIIGRLSLDPKKRVGPEMIKLGSEMMGMLSELGLDPFGSNDRISVLYDPVTRQLIANIMIGVFEEFGKPLSPEQAARYEETLARFAQLDQYITRDSLDPMGKAIARLENYDQVNTLMNDLSLVFSDEQRSVVDQTVIKEMLRPNLTNIQSVGNEKVKEQAEAGRFVLESWTSQFDPESSPPEMREALKPVAEQYVSDYAALKKKVESSYDPALMDYYFQRNRPAERAGIRNYYTEREQYFSDNPANARAKAQLDLEFLKVRRTYQQQAAKIAGEQNSEYMNFPGQPTFLYHFPNLE